MKKAKTKYKPLKEEVPEELRNPMPNAFPRTRKVNDPDEDNRSDNLVAERDVFMQQPERDTEIPPELIQRRAYLLYEERVACGKNPDNLADWFEAERQLRGEIVKKTW